MYPNNPPSIPHSISSTGEESQLQAETERKHKVNYGLFADQRLHHCRIQLLLRDLEPAAQVIFTELFKGFQWAARRC